MPQSAPLQWLFSYSLEHLILMILVVMVWVNLSFRLSNSSVKFNFSWGQDSGNYPWGVWGWRD